MLPKRRTSSHTNVIANFKTKKYNPTEKKYKKHDCAASPYTAARPPFLFHLLSL